MPGFFTHIYTCRRVADHLLQGEFPDWPDVGGALDGLDPKTCGAIMQKWEKFTHLGAIGPDMFYFKPGLEQRHPRAGQRRADARLRRLLLHR